jgi:malate synthase
LQLLWQNLINACDQLHVTRDDVNITEQDLVEIPKGTVTEEGLEKH